MSSADLTLVLAWVTVLALAIATALVARRRGVPAHVVRDLLHVGCGVWVIGWRAWDGRAGPIAIVLAAALGALFVPVFAGRARGLRRVMESVVADRERWMGVVLYTLAYAMLTTLGLFTAPFPAAAALLALALGDGIGGFVGRSIGRVRYTIPGGTPKSLEGSLAVAAAAAAGVSLASWWFGAGVGFAWIAGAGLLAAGVEAVAPRSSDNLLLPAAVWILLFVHHGKVVS